MEEECHHVCSVNAEEDVEDFRPPSPSPSLNPSEIVVLLLRPKRAFHCGSPHPGELLPDKVSCSLFHTMKARTNRRVQSRQATQDTVRLPTVGSRAGLPITR